MPAENTTGSRPDRRRIDEDAILAALESSRIASRACSGRSRRRPAPAAPPAGPKRR